MALARLELRWVMVLVFGALAGSIFSPKIVVISERMGRFMVIFIQRFGPGLALKLPESFVPIGWWSFVVASEVVNSFISRRQDGAVVRPWWRKI